jgi:hypothetical protein
MIGGKIMDLSLRAVRFDTRILAYLVVGQSVDQEALKTVAAQTGVALGTVNGATIVLGSATDDATRAAIAAAAAEPGTFTGRMLELDGATYLATISDLEQTQTGQSRPRLVLIEPLVTGAFGTAKGLMLVPLVLVLVAVMFSMVVQRRLGARH